MLKKQLLILFIISWSQYSSCFIDDLFELGKESVKFATFINDVKSTNDTTLDFSSIITRGDEKIKQQIVEKLERIDSGINGLKSNTSLVARGNHGESYATLVENVEILSTQWELSSFIAKTQVKWTSLLTYMKMGSSKEAYDHLADTIIASMGDNLAHLRDQITPNAGLGLSDSAFWTLIARQKRGFMSTSCEEGETYHQTIVRLYQMIVKTEIKAYVLESFARRLKFSNNAEWKGPMEALKVSFKNQFVAYIHEFTKSLTSPELPYLRACDPKSSWRYGDDYLAFDGFIQQTIYRSLFFTADSRRSDIVYIGLGDARHVIPLAQQLKCSGNLTDCTNIRHYWYDTLVCIWSEGPYRIRYVTEKGVTKGMDTKNPCPCGYLHSSTIDGGINYDVVEFCSCRCTTPKWKLVNQLMPSRVNDNYVIVGMRFNKVNNYVYIQIAEGKLEANGYISDFAWVPPTRRPLGKSAGVVLMDLEINRRAFFFDNLQLPAGYILTGIQFTPTTRSGINGFAIGLHGMKFDYGTGKLDLTHESFVQCLATNANREFTYKAKRATAMQPYGTQNIDSNGYTHIYLQQSELDDDYGQSTLPFLDRVPIVTRPLSPLGGVGLFHKGRADHAGFLSLRVYPIDYLHFVKTFVGTHNLTLESTWND